MKPVVFFVLAVSLCPCLQAQTIDDGIMMARHSLQVGYIYTYESWDKYWEGTLERVNGNIGTVTTQTNTGTLAYGFTDRLTVFASVPYVWTDPSLGVLQGQAGVQDLMLGGKYSFLERSPAGRGALRAIVALSGTLPLTDYTPDFAPLSIGTHSRRLSGRATLNYQTSLGMFLNGSAAYTWRADVTLDRPYYYTDGQLFFTSDVTMPDVVDYIVSLGYLKHDLNANVSFSQQYTQGGGDIRRQDMPFVSNRMNFSKVGAMAMYPIPKVRTVAAYFSLAYVVDGRNVGQARSIAAGLLYSYASHGRLIR
jgi:Putative MetA-pathway of phenol degradation